jgi:hypothetical protein
MTVRSEFSGTLLAGWFAAAGLIFACSFYYMSRSQDRYYRPDLVGPSTISRSALGHAAFAEVLRRLDVPVVVSRADSAGKVKPGGVLVMAEPQRDQQSMGWTKELLRSGNVLLVLPKRSGQPHSRRSDWIGEEVLTDEKQVNEILKLLDPDASVIRLKGPSSFAATGLGAEPTIRDPQLIRSKRLKSVVSTDAGMLVADGQLDGKSIRVMSDPDVIANHGLGQAENAIFAVSLINSVRKADGNVVFDETTHGFIVRPAHPASLLFRFPYVLVTLQVVIAIILAVWATVFRFGPPRSGPARPAAGNIELIRSGARLLDGEEHHRVVLQRYVKAVVYDAARQLHGPVDDVSATAIWLRKAGRSRGASLDCTALIAELDDGGPTDSKHLLASARSVYRWKQELVHGP